MKRTRPSPQQHSDASRIHESKSGGEDGSENDADFPVHFAAPLHSTSSDANHEHHDARLRPIICRIMIACRILQFDVETRFIAVVLLHRYAAATETTTTPAGIAQDWKFIAAACMFLASKQGEEPRRLRDMINLTHMVFLDCTDSTNKDDKRRNNNNNGDPSCEMISVSATPPKLDDKYWDDKVKLVETEQMVLRWIAFDTTVSYPYRVISLIVGSDDFDSCYPSDDGNINSNNDDKDDRDRNAIVHHGLIAIKNRAFTYINDAMFSSRALGCPALHLGCAAVSLANDECKDGNHIQIQFFPDSWWHQFHLSDDAMDSTRDILREATSLVNHHHNQE